MIKKKIVNYYPLIVLILFLFINTFGLNPKLFVSMPSYNSIVVPYIPMNISVACFIISLFGIGIMVCDYLAKMSPLIVLYYMLVLDSFTI